MRKKKAFIIGRHTPEGLGQLFEIVGQANVLFPDNIWHIREELV